MTAFQKQEYGRKIMNRFTRKYIVALLLGVLLVAIPGSRMAVGLEIVEEEIGSGSVYGLFLQDGWNGDLALYAHGYVDASSPIGLPTATQIEPLRDAMPGMGYAVAYSSFSENGWAVDDGVRRTRQLRGIFNSEFGSPNRTYLVAHSMGALVAAKLAEKTQITTAGNSNLLVQRTINRYGHGAFTVDEMLVAFLDLAEWVESEAKPSP